MASHRSGETEDTFIADLSVGLATVIEIDFRSVLAI
jgi:enolase